jgi:hypothetical protein
MGIPIYFSHRRRWRSPKAMTMVDQNGLFRNGKKRVYWIAKSANRPSRNPNRTVPLSLKRTTSLSSLLVSINNPFGFSGVHLQ